MMRNSILMFKEQLSTISQHNECFSLLPIILKSVKEKSDYIFNELNGAKGVKSVSGMGLMIGVETEKDSGEVLKKCLENGVSVLKAKNKIRLLPALNIPFDLLKKAVSVLKSACE